MSSPAVYRLAIDDVIYCLRDLAQRRPSSIFDSAFLGLIRQLHYEYGTCVTLNLFYRTTEGDFTLRDFPTCYRAEWEANASWLRLAFHAQAEFPSQPYLNAPISTLVADYEAVEAEVLRFAGHKVWTPPCVIHFCTIPAGALPTMADWGVRYLGGLFSLKSGAMVGHYGVSDDLAIVGAGNTLITDVASGITISNIDLVINKCQVDEIPTALSSRNGTPARLEKVDLLSHEQYSWPFYPHFLPDLPERYRTAIRWCIERGYQPAHWH